MRNFVKAAFVAIGAAACLCTPAAADPVNAAYQVKVAYADLNLTSEAGAATAMNRINRAAERACGQRPSPRLIKLTASREACLQEVRTAAVSAIAAPVLTALHSRTAPVRIASR